MGIDQEWDRVLENPDNVIVSDALRDVLGTIEENDNSSDKPQAMVVCNLGFKSHSIERAKLIEWSHTAREMSYVLEIATASAAYVINDPHVVCMSVQNNVWPREVHIDFSEDKTSPDVSIVFHENRAVMTMVIKRDVE